MKPTKSTLVHGDGIQGVARLKPNSVHLILSDIPYGIGMDTWDVLHNNRNSALLGKSPAQTKAGTVFRTRGKPLNGWSEADKKIAAEYGAWCSSFAKEWLRVLKPGASALVFAGRRMSPRCVVALEDAGFTFKDQLAWIRESAPHRAQRVRKVFQRRGDEEAAKQWKGWRLGNLRPLFEPILWFVKPYPTGTTLADNLLAHEVGGYCERGFLHYEPSADNILRVGFRKGERGLHVTQKPVDLMRALIELTTRPGHTVLDPFCGSGSTLVAAKELGRTYVGFERDQKIAENAKKNGSGREP